MKPCIHEAIKEICSVIHLILLTTALHDKCIAMHLQKSKGYKLLSMIKVALIDELKPKYCLLYFTKEVAIAD